MATFYIASLDLCEFLVDKDTGAPLAGGYVQFWEDANRTTPKPVFQQQNIGADPITGQPKYDYVELPNPIQLSGVGTIQDANGNNITIYYYPFDSNGEQQLYYVAAFNYLGIQQFTREGWPPLEQAEAAAVASVYQNMLLNPQFASVYFTDAGLTYNYNGSSSDIIPIGPYWDLIIFYVGAGTITVTRTSVAGSLNYATNPPYILNITGGNNLSSIQLRQRLANTPAIFGATISGVNGFVASYMLLAPGANVTLKYSPSLAALGPTTLLTANNNTGIYTGYSATTELPLSTNPDSSDLGFVDILIDIPTTGTTSFSSIQIVGLDANVQGINYVQTPVTKQLSDLGINQIDVYTRPIPSYLVGWDFLLNPSQFNTPTIGPQATGNNSSFYVRDQTIAFQSVSSGISISTGLAGALKITAELAGAHAIIQYLPAPQAIQMLSRKKCVSISANSSNVAGTDATVSLWYTTVALPSTIVSNLSIVATLDADGYPTIQHGTWLPVPCNGTGAGLNGQQLFIESAPVLSSFNQYALNGWDARNISSIYNATYFAIVIGTSSLTASESISYQSISCQDGNSPTIPAPKTYAQNLQDCQQYYWSTFPAGVIPGNSKGLLGSLSLVTPNQWNNPSSSNVAANGCVHVVFPVQMETTPTMIAYNPINNNTNWYCPATAADFYSSSFDASVSMNGFGVLGSILGNLPFQSNVFIHVSADARLGK